MRYFESRPGNVPACRWHPCRQSLSIVLVNQDWAGEIGDMSAGGRAWKVNYARVICDGWQSPIIRMKSTLNNPENNPKNSP